VSDKKRAAGPESTAIVRRALSRRGVIGGALAAAVASVVLGKRIQPRPGPKRWTGKTRWIGHC
jgi:hypothetical protein